MAHVIALDPVTGSDTFPRRDPGRHPARIVWAALWLRVSRVPPAPLTLRPMTALDEPAALRRGCSLAPEEDPMNLPDPRPDGFCAECGTKPAVTTDGRFCRKCLTALVVKISPGATQHRSSGCMQAHDDFDPSPSGENAVRAMEG